MKKRRAKMIAVGLLAAICQYRAATLKSKQISVAPSVTWIDGERAAKHLARTVRCATVSHDPDDSDPGDGAPQIDAWTFRIFHAFLQDTHPRVTESLDREIINELLSLVYRWQGTHPELEPILLTFMTEYILAMDAKGRWPCVTRDLRP